MMISRKHILLVLFTMYSVSLFAQQENTLHFIRMIPQSNYTNPAFFPEYNLHIGLPGISSDYLSFANSGFSYSDVITKRADDSLSINLNLFHDKLKKNNYLTNRASVDLLSFGFVVKPSLYFHYNLTTHVYTRTKYPSDILGLFIEGNANYIGRTVQFEASADGISYIEHGFGLACKISDKWSAGGKFKILSGVADVKQNNASFDLTTGEFYDLNLEGNISFNTSGLDKLEVLVDNFDNAKETQKNIREFASFKNSGFAVDLGATFSPSDRLSIGLSILNLGGITWKTDLTEYRLHPDSSTFVYHGIELTDIVNDDIERSDLLDSLENSLAFEENKSLGKYYSSLPTRIYLSGSYKLNRTITTGIVLFGEKFRKSKLGGIAASINKDIGKTFNMALSYSAIHNSFNNFGGGITITKSPIQFYVVSDNIFSAPFNYKNIHSVNVRFGINLIFGWNKNQDYLPNSTGYRDF